MIGCLNLNDKTIKKMVDDFVEVKVSQLLNENFPETTPTYEEFIANKNVKDFKFESLRFQ